MLLGHLLPPTPRPRTMWPESVALQQGRIHLTSFTKLQESGKWMCQSGLRRCVVLPLNVSVPGAC